MSYAIDARNTGLLSLRDRMEDKFHNSNFLPNSNIPCSRSVRVQFQHNSIGEYYEAFLWYHYQDDCFILSLSFHGKDNQGRPYTNPSCGVKRYQKLSLAFYQIEIMNENKNRLSRWIQRNTK